MNAIAEELLQRFDTGRLSRRELLQGLALLSAAPWPAAAAAATPAPSIAARSVDHVSLLVRDLERSAGFYHDVFGLRAISEDKAHRILRLAAAADTSATPGPASAIVSLRQEAPAGVVDHFAFKVTGFDRATVTRQLEQHDLTPRQNLEYGFHVVDPDGFNVQLV